MKAILIEITVEEGVGCIKRLAVSLPVVCLGKAEGAKLFLRTKESEALKRALQQSLSRQVRTELEATGCASMCFLRSQQWKNDREMCSNNSRKHVAQKGEFI